MGGPFLSYTPLIKILLQGDNLDKKKLSVSYFYMRNQHMENKEPSKHGSCKKFDGKRARKMKGRKDKPKAVCPHLLFLKLGA